MFTLATLNGLISGSLVALAGGFLLAQNRPETGARALGLFLAAWGMLIATANLAAAAPTILGLAVAREAITLLVPMFLAAFAAPREQGVTPRLLIAATGTALAGAMLLALAPTLFLGVWVDSTTLVPATGATGLLFGVLPLYAVFGIALLAFQAQTNASRGVASGRHNVLVAAGLACFLAAATAWFGGRALPGIAAYAMTRGVVDAGVTVIIFVTGLSFLTTAAHRAHHMQTTRENRRILLFCIYVPGGTALLAAVILQLGGPRIDPVSFWRIVTVALIVLAVMRHRLFDGEIRFKRTAIATLTLFAALGLALLAEGLARLAGVSALTDPPASLAVGAVFAGSIALPYIPAAQRQARRAFRTLLDPHDPSRAQNLEIYRGALEARAARGASVDAGEADLARLRAGLHIERRDHDLLALFIDRRERAPAPTFEPGARVLDGTLVVEREIGAGATGRVYECRDEAGRLSAVKVMPPLLRGGGAAGARAVGEAQMLDDLRSANVLPVLQVADRPEAFYIVTERAEGTLADRLAASPAGRLAPADALRVTREVLSGLAAAHAAGIVHRDVKPQNILLGRQGEAILADFDAAERASGAVGMPARGTPAWMAPEQFAGASVGPAADVHAAGALLYRMLAGAHYVRVDGLRPEEMRVLIERAEPALPADWPADIRAWLAQALAKEPTARFADAAVARDTFPTRWLKP